MNYREKLKLKIASSEIETRFPCNFHDHLSRRIDLLTFRVNSYNLVVLVIQFENTVYPLYKLDKAFMSSQDLKDLLF